MSLREGYSGGLRVWSRSSISRQARRPVIGALPGFSQLGGRQAGCGAVAVFGRGIAELGLARSEARGGQTEPFIGFKIILRHRSAFELHVAEAVLGQGVAFV